MIHLLPESFLFSLTYVSAPVLACYIVVIFGLPLKVFLRIFLPNLNMRF